MIAYNKQLPYLIKTSVLRIIQEFIQNSLKHSGCELITIDVTEKHGGLSVVLSDNGRGFDMTGLQAKGIGLSNMKRRIKMAGGTFELTSQVGTGTKLDVFIDHKNLFAS